MRTKKGFLDIIKKKYKDSQYAGDQYGGAAGATGNGLPLKSAQNFMFATGIECSYPTINDGKTRRDLLEETDHYNRYKEDLKLVADMGLKVLRYGLPFYKINYAPGKYDWSFADEAMAEIQRLEICPILDLMHFGVPDWLGNYQNPELPIHFANYAKEVVRRYPWVRYYTPVNEIYVTCRASAKDGLWNEQMKTDKAFVTAMKHCVAASIMATHCIAEHQPNAIIVQSESAEFIHEIKTEPSPKVKLENQLRFLSFDLLYSVPPETDSYIYLMDNGMTKEEYDWFMAGEPPGYQIMGNDYYGRNERMILPDGKQIIAEDVMGWYQITKEYYNRYKKPVFHTETNTFDDKQAVAWLWKQWANILRMRREGTPVLGFTWYSLLDQIDWDISLAEKKGNINPCGLFDLDRKIRPVGKAYKQLLKEYGQIGLLPHGEFFEITTKDARLKIAV